VGTSDHNILIIGGGVIGLSIARELHKRGAQGVTIVDKGRIGGEASWAAAGMLAPNAETNADDAFFRLCTASNELYPQFAAELLDETGIDIELDSTGTVSAAFGDNDEAALLAKFEWQRAAGIPVERLTTQAIRALEPQISPQVRFGLFYPNDWQVENRKLVSALRRYCELNGVELAENTEIIDLVVENGAVMGALTSFGTIRSQQTVIASGAWAGTLVKDRFPGLGNVKPIRGQMISLSGDGLPLKHVIYSPNGYLVPRGDGRILVGATVEDVGFSKEVTPQAIESLRAAALEIIPALVNFDIKEAWAGLRPYADEGLPLIGRIPDLENAIIATGHFRNGILLAPLTARMVAYQLLEGSAPAYMSAFAPGPATETRNAASTSSKL
jgi:glycine oxidase